MKFKVGDKVRVKNVPLCPVRGRVFTINHVEFGAYKDDIPLYSFKESDAIIAETLLEPVDAYEKVLRQIETIHSGMKSAIEKQICDKMMEIIDYKYNSETGETYIKWADKTETRVKPESDTEPNQFVGFVTAYAKKAAGNTNRINNLFEKWLVKKAARKRMRDYEARKLANEKYGVPLDFEE